MSQRRLHFYMATATVHFNRENRPRQQAMNMVMQLPAKTITASVLNDTRLALFQRLSDEKGVTNQDRRSIVFDGFSYLGFMTAKEFHNVEDFKAAEPTAAHTAA